MVRVSHLATLKAFVLSAVTFKLFGCQPIGTFVGSFVLLLGLDSLLTANVLVVLLRLLSHLCSLLGCSLLLFVGENFVSQHGVVDDL